MILKEGLVLYPSLQKKIWLKTNCLDGIKRILLTQFVTSNQRKIRFEVHFSELWSACRPWSFDNYQQ